MPGLTFLIAFQRSILMAVKRTKPITIATLIEVSGIITILLITLHGFNLIGIIGATIAYILGRTFANIYLMNPFVRATAAFNRD